MSLQKAKAKRNMVAQTVFFFYRQNKKKNGLEKEMSLRMANAKRKTAALDDILIWYTQKGKKKDNCAQTTNPHKRVIERDQPPEDKLELRFLFLSHVKGLMRGSVPVRIKVSMDKVDALLAFVRASAGLSLPESKTTFCMV